MIEIDFKYPPIWDQVKDAKTSDLEDLDYYDRYRLMNALGGEYSRNMSPDNEGAYRRMLGQEKMLRDLFFIDHMEPVEYEGDAQALERFNQKVVDSGKFEEWKQQWDKIDSLKRRGVVFQVVRMFGEAVGADLSAGHVRFGEPEIVNAEVVHHTGDITISDSKEIGDDFLKAYHSMVYACARLYQQRLLSGEVLYEDGGEREDLAWRTFGDLGPAQSLMWDADGYNNFMNQPTRRHAMWLADGAVDSLASVYAPERKGEVSKEIRESMNSRYMSAKVLYAASMPVYAPEDVWNALSPIFAHHIRGLSVDAQKGVVQLANSLHEKGQQVPDYLNNAIDKILTSYPLTPDYKKFQIEKQAKLLYKLSVDPKVADARRYWHSYDNDRKLNFLQHVVNVHAEVFEFRPSRLVAVDIPPKFDRASGHNVINYGGYEWRKPNPAINVNVNEASHAIDYFFEAVNTAVHEAQHGFQDHLARQYEWKGLKPDNPLYEQAKYFSTGSYVYVNPDQNRTHYHNNPLERDAFAMGNGVSFYIGLANEAQRHEYARQMEILSEDPSKHDLDMSRNFAGVPWNLEPPMPEPET